jgi:tryptophan synthase alpha chain
VGFGVRTAAAAAAVALTSDAVIVGSALIEIIENANYVSAGASQLEAFAHGLRLAMDDTRAAA